VYEIEVPLPVPFWWNLLPLICLSIIVFVAAAWWFLAVTWRLSIIIKLLKKQNELIKNQANGK
jgi:energy-coupling factor transporter transmembrane protein EcfT